MSTKSNPVEGWPQLKEKFKNKPRFKLADRVQFQMPVVDTDTGNKINEGQIARIDGGYIYIYVTLHAGIIQIERYPNELTLI